MGDIEKENRREKQNEVRREKIEPKIRERIFFSRFEDFWFSTFRRFCTNWLISKESRKNSSFDRFIRRKSRIRQRSRRINWLITSILVPKNNRISGGWEKLITTNCFNHRTKLCLRFFSVGLETKQRRTFGAEGKSNIERDPPYVDDARGSNSGSSLRRRIIARSGSSCFESIFEEQLRQILSFRGEQKMKNWGKTKEEKFFEPLRRTFRSLGCIWWIHQTNCMKKTSMSLFLGRDVSSRFSWNERHQLSIKSHRKFWSSYLSSSSFDFNLWV